MGFSGADVRGLGDPVGPVSSPPELPAQQRGADPSREDSGSEEPGGGHVALPSGRSAAMRAYRLAEVADVLGFTDAKPPLPAETSS